MKKTAAFFLILSALVSACNTGGDSNRDDKDSIDAVRSSDSMLQHELNKDTSAKSPDTTAQGQKPEQVPGS